MDNLMKFSLLLDDLESVVLSMLSSEDCSEDTLSRYDNLLLQLCENPEIAIRLPETVRRFPAGSEFNLFVQTNDAVKQELRTQISREFSIAADQLSMLLQPTNDSLGIALSNLGNSDLLRRYDQVNALIRGGRYGAAIKESHALIRMTLSVTLGDDWSEINNPFDPRIDTDGELRAHDELGFRRVRKAVGDLVAAILAIPEEMNQPTTGDTSTYAVTRDQAVYVVNITFATILLLVGDQENHAR